MNDQRLSPSEAPIRSTASFEGDSVNIRFGNRLCSLRTEFGVDEDEFAARLDIPVSRLQELEDGTASVTLLELGWFASVLGISVSTLLEDV